VTANVNISKGDALCRLDNPEGYKEAIKNYEKALKIDRGSKKAWTCKGLALRMLSHNEDVLKEALRNHNRALKIDPNYAVALVNKGNVLFNLGKMDKAMICYNRALDLNPDYTTGWVNKGELLKTLGKIEEAEKCLASVPGPDKIDIFGSQSHTRN
jgi:tetratricopeptide (TPR) repeat protein